MANDYTYRADHVGSLIPPAALLEARARHARGELDADGLRQAEDAAITAALQMQKTVGIAVASDGGFRRAGGSARPLDGDTLAKGEAAYLKAQARRPIKVAVPAARPSRGTPSEQGPESAVMVKREIESLIAAGVDYVQLDAPGYAPLLNAQDRAALAAQGIDPERKLEDLLRLDATALSGLERPGHVRIAVHIPRANATRALDDGRLRGGSGAAVQRIAGGPLPACVRRRGRFRALASGAQGQGCRAGSGERHDAHARGCRCADGTHRRGREDHRW